jgi:hypothetical protein
MTTIVLTQAGAGSTSFITPDYFISPFNIGLQAIVTGTVSSYSVQYTLDDTQADGYSAASGNWTTVTGFSALSASTWGAFTTPCRGIRLTVTTGPGSVALTLCQAGTR